MLELLSRDIKRIFRIVAIRGIDPFAAKFQATKHRSA